MRKRIPFILALIFVLVSCGGGGGRSGDSSSGNGEVSNEPSINGSDSIGYQPFYGTWKSAWEGSGQGTYKPMYLILTFSGNKALLERTGYYLGNLDDYRLMCSANFTYSVSGSTVHFKVVGGDWAQACFFFSPVGESATYSFAIAETTGSVLKLYGDWHSWEKMTVDFIKQ